MRIRDLVKKYNSFIGNDWDGIMDFVDKLNNKQARKMFYSIYKSDSKEGQQIRKSTKRFMQAGR